MVEPIISRDAASVLHLLVQAERAIQNNNDAALALAAYKLASSVPDHNSPDSYSARFRYRLTLEADQISSSSKRSTSGFSSNIRD
jgi:hypothetical protein